MVTKTGGEALTAELFIPRETPVALLSGSDLGN